MGLFSLGEERDACGGIEAAHILHDNLGLESCLIEQRYSRMSSVAPPAPPLKKGKVQQE